MAPQAPRRWRPATHSGVQQQGGFGLLESLVALVLFSSLGLALFSWVNTNLDAATRLRERDQAQQMQQLAVAWVQTLNPLQQPEGETELEPGLRLRWTARPLTPLTAIAPLPGGTGSIFRVRLFEVEMQLQPSPPQQRTATPAMAWRTTRMGVERDPVTSGQEVRP